MGEITSRTVGEGGDAPLELTIEEQIAQEDAILKADEESRLQLVEGLASAAEAEPTPENGADAGDTPWIEDTVRATYFETEPLILLQGVFRAGEIELPLTVDEAQQLVAKIKEALIA